MPTKSVKADLPLFGNLYKSSVIDHKAIVSDQDGHRYEEFDRKCVGPHLDQPVTVGSATLKPSQAAQTCTIKQQVA